MQLPWRDTGAAGELTESAAAADRELPAGRLQLRLQGRGMLSRRRGAHRRCSAQLPPVAAFTASYDTSHKRLFDETDLGKRLTR